MLKYVVDPVPFDKLSEKLLCDKPDLGPQKRGTVDMIVLRPAVNERKVVNSAAVTVEEGVIGSGWKKIEERGLIDQVCVMSSAAIRAIAGDDMSKWPDAGDQLFIDMDLSKDNLPVGTMLRIGEFECKVSPKPHTGCSKFRARYGDGALKAVSTLTSKKRRLRGIYFEVTKPGRVKVGDSVEIIAA